MTTKHTPKSWIVEQVETSHNGYADWPVYAVRQMPENHCLAVVGRVDRATAGYNEANAQLMAIAPDLLAACKGALAALTQGVTVPKDVERARKILRAGIEKAG